MEVIKGDMVARLRKARGKEMTTGRLYRIPNTELRIYAVEEDGDVRWTKPSGDHTEIRNMRKSTTRI